MRALDPIDADDVLPAWTKRTDAVQACFWKYDAGGRGLSREAGGGVEYDAVAGARPKAGAWRTVVLLSYENPKGASGGILAVIRRLPAEMERREPPATGQPAGRREVIRLSPQHTGLKSRYAPEQLQLMGRCRVYFEGRDVVVTVNRVAIRADETWYVFGADGFFEADGGVGGTDPYIDGREDQATRNGADSRLLRDSLFACKAVPVVLRALGRRSDLILHAQDWEFASAALTVKEALIAGELERAAVVLTLHNPYDHDLSEANLARFTSRSAGWFWPKVGGLGRPTVLTRMIPLLDAPVSVVSHQFARELTSAPLQTGVFATHLQGVFAYQGLVGIDNGDFGRGGAAPFSAAAVARARAGDASAILAEKAAKRAAMLRALAEYQDAVTGPGANPDRVTMGKLLGGEGKPLGELPDDVPVFMMIGRLDPGQKGYDVCAQLIESLPRGAARFVLTPMSPLAADAAVQPFFEQLARLAAARAGEVVVFAHKMNRAYQETMAGATYSLWPSRYEPFGGASEFYEAGTPVIAHGVGGLLQQVIDYEQNPREATGFLYDRHATVVPRPALEAEFRAAHEARPAERMAVPVYRRECETLVAAVRRAIDLFRYEPTAYGGLLANLSEMLGTLGWEKPVKDYLRWYDTAGR